MTDAPKTSDDGPALQPPLLAKADIIARYGAHGSLVAVIFWAGTELRDLNGKIDTLAARMASMEAKIAAFDAARLDERLRAMETQVAELRALRSADRK